MSDSQKLLNSLEVVIQTGIDSALSSVFTSMPGIIQSVDFSKMTCTAKIAIRGKIQLENGEIQSVEYPLLVDVPIVFPSCGDFLITFPLKSGDEVLIHFASRCIDSWWQSGGIQEPMESRKFDLSDGFAIPGPFSVPRVPGSVSTGSLQIRTTAGTTYLELDSSGKIKLVSPVGVEVAGNLSVSGTITGAVVQTSLGIGLGTHKHSGVTPGTGTSGVPIP